MQPDAGFGSFAAGVSIRTARTHASCLSFHRKRQVARNRPMRDYRRFTVGIRYSKGSLRKPHARIGQTGGDPAGSISRYEGRSLVSCRSALNGFVRAFNTLSAGTKKFMVWAVGPWDSLWNVREPYHAQAATSGPPQTRRRRLGLPGHGGTLGRAADSRPRGGKTFCVRSNGVAPITSPCTFTSTRPVGTITRPKR